MAAKTPSTLLMDIGDGLFMMVGLPRLVLWRTRERPKKAARGTFGYNYQTSSLEYFDGLVWYAASLSKA